MEFHFRPKSQENEFQISILPNFHFIENETAKFFRFPFLGKLSIFTKCNSRAHEKQAGVSHLHSAFHSTSSSTTKQFLKHVSFQFQYSVKNRGNGIPLMGFPFSQTLWFWAARFPFYRFSILSRMNLQGFWSPDFHFIEFPFHQ